MEAITYGHWVQEEKTICRRKYSSFGKFSRHTPTNCFKIRNKLYKLYNANQLVLTMHVRERLTNFCTYLLRTWQHGVDWWKSLMKNQPVTSFHTFHQLGLQNASKTYFQLKIYFHLPGKEKEQARKDYKHWQKQLGVCWFCWRVLIKKQLHKPIWLTETVQHKFMDWEYWG